MATINMHMKFEIEIPKETWFMLRKPCRLQTDGRTDKVNPVYPPSNFVGKKLLLATKINRLPNSGIGTVHTKFDNEISKQDESYTPEIMPSADGRTDRQTDKLNPVYFPPILLGGV